MPGRSNIKSKPRAGRVTKLRQAVEPKVAAQRASLRYVSDDQPGLTRVRRGGGFVYQRADGRAVRNPAVLQRIRSLVIPPAWTDVWICPHADGHLQATGHDARKRKQYRYHPDWRVVRDETKYGRMLLFGTRLPRMRSRVRRDLKLPGVCRERVLATIVRLMDTTFMRVGNEKYSKENGSYGLTTLRNRHVQVRGENIRFSFRGKSGKSHAIEVHDRRLAKIVRRCRDLPGQELFSFLDDDGRPHSVHSTDVNEYLREISGEEFTAKDFRTWGGTVLTAELLGRLEAPRRTTEAKREIARAIASVAQQLGNTVAVCRKCYIHPRIIECYTDASLKPLLGGNASSTAGTSTLRTYERAVVQLLRKRA
jgi:DNA topoisomerase-1